MNQTELQTLVETKLNLLLGAPLQEVRSHERGFVLCFWQKKTYWLILDLFPAAPVALLFEDVCPLMKSTQKKPMDLFLRKYAQGGRLTSVRMIPEKGRAFELEIRSEESICRLGIDLIPHFANVSAWAKEVSHEGGRKKGQEKQIYWSKPRQQPVAPTDKGPEKSINADRPLAILQKEWIDLNFQKGTKEKVDPSLVWKEKKERDLKKKRKALQEISKIFAENQAELFQQRGEAMKSGESELIDPRQSRSWNIEEAFRRAKQARAKREGSRKRMELLAQEISELERLLSAPQPTIEQSAPEEGLLKKAEAKGRRFDLGNGMVAWLGKSAADNLRLLRQAKGWYMWMHLRDYPGAHVIIQKNRQDLVSEKDRQKVALWLIEQTLSKKTHWGQLEVAMAECRHVRPLKGDQVGRVTYQNGIHFTVRQQAGTS